MMDDETKKAMDFVQQHLATALQDHLGEPLTKDRMDAVKDEIQKFVDKLNKQPGLIKISDVEVVGDTIKYKLQQPSFASQILPVLQGPYSLWFEDDMVHVAGRLGDFAVRVCDYATLQPGGYGCSMSMVTCLGCLVHRTSIDTGT